MSHWLDIGVNRKIVSSEYQPYGRQRSRASHRVVKFFESLDLDPKGLILDGHCLNVAAEKPMKPLLHWILFLTVLSVVGCSNVLVSQDYNPHTDFSRYHTWQWQHRVQPTTGDLRIDNPLLDKRIRRAVEEDFKRRNFKLVQRHPDFLVNYHLSIEQKIQSDTYYAPVGMGGYYYPWYGGFGADTVIRQYDQAHLTIDILAADTGDLLWRGTGIYLFKTYRTPQDADAAIRETVDRILSQYPPGGGS
jgi:hypothetical protein